MINGEVKIQITLIASIKLYKTVFNLSGSSLIKIQGVVSSMYLLALLTTFQISSSAFEKSSSSNNSSTFPWHPSTTDIKLLSISLLSFGCGITPSKYFSTIETDLLTRLPKSFTKSELNLFINLSVVKLPSLPKVKSLKM